ncbi:MAG TPA: plastocyanin/azurin family copper-binding protein [Thermoanaerobaculia bacterium]|nr:plastocyanin/azurin family copper-binding protein [Thermoanaerobaculia bacterium]
MTRIPKLASLLATTLVAALAISSCGGGGGGGNGGGSPTEPPRPAQTIVVQVKDNSYEPKSVKIEPGDTVRWVFSGADRTHTVTAVNGAFDSGAVFTSSGAAFERRFDTAGTWDYSCKAHKQCCLMQGSVRVGNGSPEPTPGYE